MGEPAMGGTVLSGTAGDGPNTIEPPHPMSPESSHVPAATKIAIDRPMYSRRPFRDFSTLTGLEFFLAILNHSRINLAQEGA